MEPQNETGITRTVSDVLLGISTPSDRDEDDLNSNHAASRTLHLSLAILPLHETINAVASAPLPQPRSLPTEILQDIYRLLGPKDFNAARHTCRDWMRASLDKKILVAALKRGGWWISAEDELGSMDQIPPGRRARAETSDEWLLSRRLSRECSLASGWTGNGLSAHESETTAVVASIDFTDFTNGYTGPERHPSAGLVFTTSVCGQLLVVAKETLIYIYSLHGSTIQPLTSVGCPRRVLALSMDVTSGRNAVAALLEGRLGMLCELRCGQDESTESLIEVPEQEVEPSFSDHQENIVFNSIDVQSDSGHIQLDDIDQAHTRSRNWVNQCWNLHLQNKAASIRKRGIPIETGTATFYRHLCSEDDPPRCVAICPQRRCVAFGCSSGIELHWIDALTGQSLSRWFPLTAPSDYIFFLPPRQGIESATKLRLISSAAHPDDRPSICRKFFPSRPTFGHLLSTLGFGSTESRFGTTSCDHYHAVPVSDGHHILFLDPPSGNLFLGCDAPLGGPTKLTRKIQFVPPSAGATPRLYTAARDLSWGARVVVAFDDVIMLYSVPADVLALSYLEQNAESHSVYTAPLFQIERRKPDHWLNWLADPPKVPDEDVLFCPVWPVVLKGIEIGRLGGVCDLAVYTDPELTIWAFTLDPAACTAWQVHRPGANVARGKYRVGADGEVNMTQGVAQDVETETETGIGFDGHCSQTLTRRIPGALAIENDEWVDLIDVRGCDAWFDGDGDVIIYNTAEAVVLGQVWDVGR
ncbi:hypothetical protein EJ04DRAFT_572231 [Polyplosphaeria fusca]|uniref:F-box domain-containing protein n=1 Tax=Polyplosphaeria fusca TaxID=682080 RepID=A0A9P4RBE7_9PLEO|nr:hypothetical protein EJ04DRAFT_572231 [Polyplosphaeria fusca]